MSCLARRLALAVAVLIGLALLSFAVPIPAWRTGELPAPPLPVVEGGPAVHLPRRVWIDTDAAGGHGRTTDPDDCFAVLFLASARGVDITGISTVHGNAPLPVTDRTARDLVAALRHDGVLAPPVYRGSPRPLGEGGAAAPTPPGAALREALGDGPLTVVSLGPLTNVAAAIADRPDLRAGVARLVAVMGRRPGHLFHPAEGAGGGILFGHGPVFRDFNFDQDRRAAALVLGMRLPTTFVPYDAARDVSLRRADLARMRARGGAAAWVASRAGGWLEFWEEDVGRNGFYPFDLVAAAYTVEPRLFDCAEATAWVGPDRLLWRWLYQPDALLVGRERDGPAAVRTTAPVVYCVRARPAVHPLIVSGSPGGPGTPPGS